MSGVHGKPPYRIAGIPAGIISADDYDVTDEALAYLARAALVETALDLGDELRLWQPGRKGYAAAQERFFAALRAAREGA